MRDIAVAILVFGSLPLILKRPSIGIAMWCWISYMNPHRLAFGFARDFPFALLIALCTLLALLFSRETKQFPRMNLLTTLWLLFFLWLAVTTVLSIYPDRAYPKYFDFFKVLLMTLVTVVVMCDRRRLHLLIWTIVVSVGFYGIKGGWFTLTTGGVHRVWGPPSSFIEDNNALALALFMLLPLAYYLRSQSDRPVVRNGLMLAMLLMTISAVGSYSRGGLLAGLSMCAMLWLKSRNKLMTGAAFALLIPILFFFMPQSWHDRMSTIGTYQEDSSAMNRIEAWTMCYNAANQRPFGGGFGMWSAEIYRRYGPASTGKDPGTRGAHSIYFSVMGEHGWIGLILFLATFAAAWRTGTWIIRATADVDELAWAASLARMVQVSLVAYATGGAFQSLAYFDYPWHLVAILLSARMVVERELSGATETTDDAADSRRRLPGLRAGRAGLSY